MPSCPCVEFEINEETREYLKRLEGPVGVISVAGMYRSGKSYLLNRVLLNQSRGFDVGHTINACTKVRKAVLYGVRRKMNELMEGNMRKEDNHRFAKYHLLCS